MFLDCPDLRFISKEPHFINYQFPKKGFLHITKVNELLSLIESSSTIPTKQIADILQGHQLTQTLPYMEEDELADFLRHVLILNSDKLDWDYIDQHLMKLNSRFPSRWKFPHVDLDDAVRELFSSIVLINPTSEELNLLDMFLLDYSGALPLDLDFYKKLLFDFETKYRPISFLKYMELYTAYLNELYWVKKDNFEFRKLMIKLEQFFDLLNVKFRENLTISDLSRYLLDLSISRIKLLKPKFTIDLDVHTLMKLQNLITKNGGISMSLTSWILGAFLAVHVLSIRQIITNIEVFVSIINKIFQFLIPYSSISEFKKAIADIVKKTRLHPYLFLFMMEGYSACTELLNYLIRRLISSSHRSHYVSIYHELVEFIDEISSIYINCYYNMHSEHKNTSFSLNFAKPLMMAGFEKIMFYDKIYFFHCENMSLERKHKKLELLLEYCRKKKPELYHYIENILLIENQDYFAEKHKEYELLREKLNEKEKEMYLFSSFFENEVLKKLAIILKQRHASERIPIVRLVPPQIYAIQYIKQWLQIFYSTGFMFEELFSLLFPIVLDLQAERIEKEYNNQNFALAFVQSVNYVLMAKVQEELEEEFLTLGSKKVLEGLNKEIISIVQSFIKEDSLKAVSHLTRDIGHALLNELSERTSSNSTMGKIQQLYNTFHTETLESLGKTQLDIGEYANVVVAFSSLLHKLDQDESQSIRDLIQSFEASLPATLKDEKPYSIGSSIPFVPLRHEEILAEAIRLFPMMINIPPSFFDIKSET